jgi:hypothetical protein
MEDISEIIPGLLYLSSRVAPENKAALQKRKISHVLSLTQHPIPTFPDLFQYKLINIDDAGAEAISSHFQSCHEFIGNYPI